MSESRKHKLEVEDVAGDTSETSSEEKFMDTVQTVLGRFYYRTAERLKMRVKPPCYSNLERCSQTHWRSQEITFAPHSMIEDCRLQKSQGKFSCLFSYINNNMCLRGMCPGPEILILLMQIILDTVDQQEESPEFVIHQSIQQFEKILIQFPPCILQLEPSYSTLLTQKCNLVGLEEFCDGKNGILVSIINSIHHLLQNPNENSEKDGLESSGSQCETEETLKFLTSDRKDGFSHLNTSVKLDRLFAILHFLVKLMEFDLAMWMLRHPKKASGSMLKPAKQPLIAKILWPDGNFSITFFMKKAFTVFVEMIIQEISGFQMEIFDKFICLMSNAVNLCEIQTSADVQFPCIQQKSKTLADTFMQIITDCKDSTPSLFLSVLKHVTSPIMRMLMTDNFFSSIEANSEPVSITKILKIFRKKELWITQSKISQQDFCMLFMDTMQCWLDVYRLHDIMLEFSGSGPTPTPQTPPPKRPSLEERIAAKETEMGRGGLRMDYAKMDKDLDKLLKKFQYNTPITYNELKLDCSFIGIGQIYQMYLDEMKSVLKLHKLLVSRHEKYPTLFRPWIEMIEKEFGFAIIK